MIGPFRVSQLLSIALVIAGIVLYIIGLARSKNHPIEQPTPEEEKGEQADEANEADAAAEVAEAAEAAQEVTAEEVKEAAEAPTEEIKEAPTEATEQVAEADEKAAQEQPANEQAEPAPTEQADNKEEE